MKITTRCTYDFIELKVDEVEVTIFKSDKHELESMIRNAIKLLNDLMSYTDKSITEFDD